METHTITFGQSRTKGGWWFECRCTCGWRAAADDLLAIQGQAAKHDLFFPQAADRSGAAAPVAPEN